MKYFFSLLFREMFVKSLIRYPELILLAFLAIFIFVKGGHDRRFLTGDGKGYYAYLPAMFIYKDVQFNFIDEYEEKYYGPQNYADFRNTVNGRYLNKYFSGMSILWLPFFLAAHLFATFFGTADGYSAPYQIAIGLASLFYLALALFFIRKILNTYRISDNIISATLIILVIGTNLFYFTVFDASYSHVYSMSIISGFIFFSRKYLFAPNKLTFYWAVLFLGLLILVRPVNILVILSLPFLSGSFDTLKKSIISLNFKKLTGAFSILFLLMCYQLVWWKMQSGEWLIWPYISEGFDFSEPNIFNFLFSYKKGFFVYAPVLLLVLPGFWFLYKRSKFQAISLFVFLSIVVYVISSWHSWWYGMSYGSRPMIDYMAFFAILTGIGLENMKKKIQLVIFPIVLFLLIISQIQQYQFYNYIFHWSNMNKVSYWRVFLKTGNHWRGVLWNNQKLIEKEESVIQREIFPENNSLKTLSLNKNNPVITLVEVPVSIFGDNSIYLKTSMKTFLPKLIGNKCFVEFKISNSSGKAYLLTKHFLIEEVIHRGEWQQTDFYFDIPEIHSPSDIVTINLVCVKGKAITKEIHIKVYGRYNNY